MATATRDLSRAEEFDIREVYGRERQPQADINVDRIRQFAKRSGGIESVEITSGGGVSVIRVGFLDGDYLALEVSYS
jgi:hypothetical protein